MFESKVDMRSKKAMINFLVNHFRYDTMNSWNRSTAYANNMKITHLDLPSETKDKLWDMLDVDCYELRWSWDELIEDFLRETGYSAGWNGRSGGYLVMYETEYDYKEKRYKVYPGRSIDDYDAEDFEEYDMDWLKERVRLVQRFDQLCSDIIAEAVYFAENYEIVEEEYTVTKTRKVLQEVV